MPGKENFTEETFTFKRSAWKVVFRWFIFVLLLFLNISLVGSTFAQHLIGRPQDLVVDLVTYVVVFFFDLIIGLPLLFEVDSIWLLPDKLVVRTLLWKTRLPWEDIVSVSKPMWLKFLILRSKHVIYLVHRTDLQPFDMLVEKIADKVGPGKFRD